MSKQMRRFVFSLALIVTATLAVWSQDPHSSRITMEPKWSGLMGSMDKMHAAMAAVQPSGNSDADFVRLMLPHHQAAIDMARTQLLYGNDPQMRRLAQEIIADQQSEIELMQLWLKQHGTDSLKQNGTPALDASKEH